MIKDLIRIFKDSWKRILLTFAILAVIVIACESDFVPSQSGSARILYIILVCLSIPEDYVYNRKTLRASRVSSLFFAALYALAIIIYVFTLEDVLRAFF